MEQEWLTEAEASTVLNVSRPVLWQMRKRGELKFSRFGPRSIRYRRADLEAYMLRREGAPMETPPPVPQPKDEKI